MAFVRFEDLRVFKLAEKLCDDIWGIAISWKYFKKNTVGIQLVKAADSIERISQKAPVGGHPKIINVL